MAEIGSCDVCGKEPALGVGSMLGVPMSFAYGRACLAANAHPYFAVVANTVAISGLDQAAPWWIQLVEDTLKHLEISQEQFDADVAKGLQDEEEYFAREMAADASCREGLARQETQERGETPF